MAIEILKITVKSSNFKTFLAKGGTSVGEQLNVWHGTIIHQMIVLSGAMEGSENYRRVNKK